MNPLAITAALRGPLTNPPMLDGLLGYVIARRLGLVAGFGPIQKIAIPIARDESDRFYLCSSPVFGVDQRELRYVNRRFPLHEAQLLGEIKSRRIDIGAGACRSYRIPTEVQFVEGDRIVWYASGDAEATLDLLTEVTHLGRRRAVGRGPVQSWTVAPCEPWDGFPILRAGQPLRPLPAGYPGLVDPAMAYQVIDPPYYEHVREELCAVPA